MAKSSVFHRRLDHQPLFIERAEGVYLYEKGTGRRVLDGCGGAAVVSVGHCVPEIVQGVAEQLGRVPYINSAAFAHDAAEELASMLCRDSGMSRAVFLSGGSEGIESAIKLCRQYHVESGHPERVNYIARQGSYHGNTIGALSLGRHAKRRQFYLPLLSSTFHEVSPCNTYRFKSQDESDEDYVQRLAKELDDKFKELGPDTVAAFFMEPVVGAATGCVPFVPGYMTAMREVCHRHGALFVVDEIMCGFGRSGKLHAWQWDDCRPDVQVLGKGINGGYAPLSAVLISDKVVKAFESSAIGCRAGLECYKYLVKRDLVSACLERGLQLESLLREHVLPLTHVGDVRGKGLFWGVEFVKDKATKEPFGANVPIADLVVAECLKLDLNVYPGMKGTADGNLGDHIMICPPYTISADEITRIVDIVKLAIQRVTLECIGRE